MSDDGISARFDHFASEQPRDERHDERDSLAGGRADRFTQFRPEVFRWIDGTRLASDQIHAAGTIAQRPGQAKHFDRVGLVRLDKSGVSLALHVGILRR